MSIPPEDAAELRSLEESLWRAETRFDRAHMDRVLTDDFVEFGRSGRFYDREATLAPESEEMAATLPLPDFEATLLSPGVALVTYRSIRRIEGEEQHARRTSIWLRTDGAWKLRFHQATPLQPDQPSR